MARTQSKPSLEDARARYAARSLRMWWTPDKGMLHSTGVAGCDGRQVRGDDPAADRAEAKPAKGQAWDSCEHRAADALVAMCDAVEVAERIETPMLAHQPLLVTEVGLHGPADDRRDPRRRRDGRAAAGQRERSNRCWSTTTGSRSRSGNAPAACHRRSCGRCCCATGTAGVGTATCATGCRSIICGRGRGVAPTIRRTWPRCAARRAPPDADPARTVGAGRQPQPARRAPTRPPRRPHRRTGRTGRAATPTRTPD